MKHAIGLASIGFALLALVACQEDAVNPVWQAMCEAICTRGVECFPVDLDYGRCASACLDEFGNEPCEGNQTALDECVAGIGALSCTALDEGELPPVCDQVCTGPLCEDVDCDDENECTADLCNASDGSCSSTPVSDGTLCSNGACQNGACGTVFPCTEQGILDAIQLGGGPFTFACDGATTIRPAETIRVTNDVILDGEGKLTLDGNNERVVVSVARVEAELRNLTITGGYLSSGGGGLENRGSLTLTGVVVSGNYGVYLHGAISNSGTLTLTESQVSNNSGLGIFNDGTATLRQTIVSGNSWSDGGGVHNAADGVLFLIDSTLSGNVAQYAGGGLFNAGAAQLTNTTVTDNTVESFGRESGGGGIMNFLYAELTLINSTVSGNHAIDNGGGIANSGIATLVHCTVSGNDGGAIQHAPYGGPRESMMIANSIVDGTCSSADGTASAGHNLESPGNTCGFDDPSDQVSVPTEALNLGPLGDNGGPTLTQALERPSDAIDVIEPEDCLDADGQPLTTDQRGVERPQGQDCDVGAVEVAMNP